MVLALLFRPHRIDSRGCGSFHAAVGEAEEAGERDMGECDEASVLLLLFPAGERVGAGAIDDDDDDGDKAAGGPATTLDEVDNEAAAAAAPIAARCSKLESEGRRPTLPLLLFERGNPPSFLPLLGVEFPSGGVFDKGGADLCDTNCTRGLISESLLSRGIITSADLSGASPSI